MENLKIKLKYNEFKSDATNGKLNLFEFSNDLFSSKILTDNTHLSEMIRVCEFAPNDGWSLLYRGSRDGFGTDDFHAKCDGHSQTLAIIHAKDPSENIFGGYTNAEWDKTSGYMADSDAFLFSLTNQENQPFKMKIKPNMASYAIYCNRYQGLSFGSSELYIRNGADENKNSFSYLGRTFSHPEFLQDRDDVKEFLAGSNTFQIKEIEAYKKI